MENSKIKKKGWTRDLSLKSIPDIMKRPRAYRPKKSVRCPECGILLKQLPCLDCKING